MCKTVVRSALPFFFFFFFWHGIPAIVIGVTLTEIQTHRALHLSKLQNFVTGRQEACFWQQIVSVASSVSSLDVQNGVERSSRLEWRDLTEWNEEI